MPVVSRRQAWRPWPIKDPAAERTRLENLRIRRAVDVTLQNAPTIRRNATTLQANVQIARGVRWRKAITIRPPAILILPLGARQANRVTVARRASVDRANWLIAHNKWMRKEFTPTAEINLTLRPRSLDFAVGPRGDLTLRPRTTALTVGDR